MESGDSKVYPCELTSKFYTTGIQNINRLRQGAGLSVKDLRNVFGLATPRAVYKWLHGTALPSLDNLVVLAAALKVRLDDILVTNTTD